MLENAKKGIRNAQEKSFILKLYKMSKTENKEMIQYNAYILSQMLHIIGILYHILYEIFHEDLT